MILIFAIYKKILPQESIVTSLNHKLRTLLGSFPAYRNQIKKILILNFNSQVINSTEFENKVVINSVGVGRGKNVDFNREIIEIISNTVIINTSEIFSTNNTNIISDDNVTIINENRVTDEIKKIIGLNKIFFIADPMRPRFARILLSFDNLVGFYSRSNSGRSNFKEIQYPRKYLRMIIQLNQSAGKVFLSDSKNDLPFLIEFKRNFGKKKKRLYIYGGDDYLSDIIVSIFEKKGNFFRYDCIKGDYNIGKNCVVYIYDNIDSLTQSARSELLSNITKAKTTNYILLRSNSYLGDISLSNFAKLQVPSIEKILPEIPLIFNMMIKEKSTNKNFNLNKKLWQRNIKSKAALNFYKSLKSLYELDYIVENVLNNSEKKISPGNQEFWYELLYGERLVTIREQFLQREIEKRILSKGSLTDLVQMLVAPKKSDINTSTLINPVKSGIKNKPEGYGHQSEHPFQFLRRENNKLKIIFEGKDIALRNEDLLGLHYLRLIIKYSKNGISYQEIENNYRDYIIETNEKPQLETADMMEGDDDDNITTLNPIEKFDGYEFIDKATIQALKEKIESLEEKKEILESELNIDEAESIDIELDKLYKYLDIGLNIKRESRTTNTEIEKSKRRVKKAINVAFKQIKVENLKFYSYLVKSIVLDKSINKYIYIPDPKIDWVLDL